MPVGANEERFEEILKNRPKRVDYCCIKYRSVVYLRHGETALGRSISERTEKMSKKKPFYRVKYQELRDISEKAVVVKCFDGSEDVLPKSQIIDEFSLGKTESVLVPCWLAEKKNIQYSEKKVWINV